MRRTGLAIACLFLVAPPSRAASPNPESLAVPAEVASKARHLVEQLGSPNLRARDAAQKELAELGRLARPALVAGATASDCAETRHRCNLLLGRATELDIRARLDTFLADAEGRYEHGLPGWDRFRVAVCREYRLFAQVVWSDRSVAWPARELFARLYANPDHRRYLQALDGSRFDLAEMVTTRRLEFNSQRIWRDDEYPLPEPTADEVATLLFAESRLGSLFVTRRGNSTSSLMSSSGFTAAARAGDERSLAYLAIAAAWLNSRNEPRDMYQALNIAWNLDLTEEGCALAARLLVTPGVTANYRNRTASTLVSTGSPRHAALVEPAFESRALVSTVYSSIPFVGGPIEQVHDIEMRDLALSIAVHLAGKSPAEFGFADRSDDRANQDYRSFSYTRYYFRDDAARRAAFTKWMELRAARE